MKFTFKSIMIQCIIIYNTFTLLQAMQGKQQTNNKEHTYRNVKRMYVCICMYVYVCMYMYVLTQTKSQKNLNG